MFNVAFRDSGWSLDLLRLVTACSQPCLPCQSPKEFVKEWQLRCGWTAQAAQEMAVLAQRAAAAYLLSGFYQTVEQKLSVNRAIFHALMSGSSPAIS